MTNRDYASKGYKAVTTAALTTGHYYGLNITVEAEVTSITAPTGTSPEGTAYDGDEAGLAGVTLPPGFYPFRFSTITLASGAGIAWIE